MSLEFLLGTSVLSSLGILQGRPTPTQVRRLLSVLAAGLSSKAPSLLDPEVQVLTLVGALGGFTLHGLNLFLTPRHCTYKATWKGF